MKKILFDVPSRLNSIRTFRDEVFSLLDHYDYQCIKNSPIVLLKESRLYESIKYSYKLSSFPLNPNNNVKELASQNQ